MDEAHYSIDTWPDWSMDFLCSWIENNNKTLFRTINVKTSFEYTMNAASWQYYYTIQSLIFLKIGLL